MDFFKLAVDAGFGVEKIWEEVMDAVMFEKDPGVSIESSGNNSMVSIEAICSHVYSKQDELLRRTVFGYELRWTEGSLKGQ